jgi:hypothetical protein
MKTVECDLAALPRASAIYATWVDRIVAEHPELDQFGAWVLLKTWRLVQAFQPDPDALLALIDEVATTNGLPSPWKENTSED